MIHNRSDINLFAYLKQIDVTSFLLDARSLLLHLF